MYWFSTSRVALGLAALSHPLGGRKMSRMFARRPYGTKMYGKLNYLAIFIPSASLCLRLTSFSKRLSITSIIQPKLFGYKCGTCVQWNLNHLPSQQPCRKKAVMLICYALTIPQVTMHKWWETESKVPHIPPAFIPTITSQRTKNSDGLFISSRTSGTGIYDNFWFVPFTCPKGWDPLVKESQISFRCSFGVLF